jgi:hypothetical protein
LELIVPFYLKTKLSIPSYSSREFSVLFKEVNLVIYAFNHGTMTDTQCLYIEKKDIEVDAGMEKKFQCHGYHEQWNVREIVLSH